VVMIIAGNGFPRQGGRKQVSKHHAPIASFASQVVYILITRFKLKRKEAEWLCYRLLPILERGHTIDPPAMIASLMYTEWAGRFQSEYNTL
jgi:hypothetical protein